jgi:hypothetical protein
MVVVMVAASRQHQQQRSANNGNNQLFHGRLVLSCPHIIAHFHATGGTCFIKRQKHENP